MKHCTEYNFFLIVSCCFLLLNFFWTVSSCTGGQSPLNDCKDNNNDGQKLPVEKIKVGMQVTCVDCLEHIMKDPEYGSSFRYIVKIKGTVNHVTGSVVNMTITEIRFRYLKKDGTKWVPDRSVHKRPPYDVGDTYVCQPGEDEIDNAVSTGKHVISIIQNKGG